MSRIILQSIDYFFILFHSALILFNVFGWIIPKWRFANLISGSTPNCVGFEPIKKSQPQITLIYTNLFNPKITRILIKFVTKRSQPVCRREGWLMKQIHDPMRIGEAIYTNPFNSKNILILIKFV